MVTIKMQESFVVRNVMNRQEIICGYRVVKLNMKVVLKFVLMDSGPVFVLMMSSVERLLVLFVKSSVSLNIVSEDCTCTCS